jgi:predicted peptidase
MTLRLILFFFVLLTPFDSLAQDYQTGFLDRTITVGEDEFNYQVFVPRNYDPKQDWPVTLFLHGIGERGSDGIIQTDTGLGTAIRKYSDRWPMITVFPQVPDKMSWQGLPSDIALAALDAAIDEFNGDETRIYLTGLSLGGNGVWYMGYKHPERFAAMVPICGFVQLPPQMPSFISDASDDVYRDLALKIANIPVWIFHGDADTVVSVEESRKMSVALESAGANVHFTELSGIGHNAWDPAYSMEELATWLLAQRKE